MHCSGTKVVHLMACAPDALYAHVRHTALPEHTPGTSHSLSTHQTKHASNTQPYLSTHQTCSPTRAHIKQPALPDRHQAHCIG